MSTEDTQVVEATSSTEETTETTTDVETGETQEETVPKSQFNQVLARAKKAEDALKKYKPITNTEATQQSVKPSDILKADEFKLYRQGYTEQEIDLIMKNGGMAILLDEKNPLVLGLRASKEQRQAEEASSRAQDTSGTSELERKYSRADIEKMKPEELEKVLGFAN